MFICFANFPSKHFVRGHLSPNACIIFYQPLEWCYSICVGCVPADDLTTGVSFMVGAGMDPKTLTVVLQKGEANECKFWSLQSECLFASSNCQLEVRRLEDWFLM